MGLELSAAYKVRKLEIIRFGVFIGYVDNNKNIEYHQPSPLNCQLARCSFQKTLTPMTVYIIEDHQQSCHLISFHCALFMKFFF